MECNGQNGKENVSANRKGMALPESSLETSFQSRQEGKPEEPKQEHIECQTVKRNTGTTGVQRRLAALEPREPGDISGRKGSQATVGQTSGDSDLEGVQKRPAALEPSVPEDISESKGSQATVGQTGDSGLQGLQTPPTSLEPCQPGDISTSSEGRATVDQASGVVDLQVVQRLPKGLETPCQHEENSGSWEDEETVDQLPGDLNIQVAQRFPVESRKDEEAVVKTPGDLQGTQTPPADLEPCQPRDISTSIERQAIVHETPGDIDLQDVQRLPVESRKDEEAVVKTPGDLQADRKHELDMADHKENKVDKEEIMTNTQHKLDLEEYMARKRADLNKEKTPWISLGFWMTFLPYMYIHVYALPAYARNREAADVLSYIQRQRQRVITSLQRFRHISEVVASLQALASQGFYGTPDGEEIRCVCCDCFYPFRCPSSDVAAIHRQISPDCPIVTCSGVGNVPDQPYPDLPNPDLPNLDLRVLNDTHIAQQSLQHVSRNRIQNRIAPGLIRWIILILNMTRVPRAPDQILIIEMNRPLLIILPDNVGHPGPPVYIHVYICFIFTFYW